MGAPTVFGIGLLWSIEYLQQHKAQVMLSPVFLVYLLYECHTTKLNLHFLYPSSLYVGCATLSVVSSRPIDDAL
jgi:hypothetical protein